MWSFKVTREIIGNLLKARGLEDTNQTVGDLIGVNESNVRYWVKTGNLPSDLLVKLSNSLGVSVDFLIGSQNIADEPQVAYAGTKGQYSTVEEVHEEDWNYIKKVVQNNNHIKIFRVIGDSMAPTLWDTDIVFCFPHETNDEIKDTHIYVIESVHHGLLIKRIVDKKDGNITVYGDNRIIAKAFPLNLEKEVLSLYRVRTKMTWQLGAPTHGANIEQLEDRITKLESLLK